MVALFVIRGWVQKHDAHTFEEFLLLVLKGDSMNMAVFAVIVSAVQCAYAASELLILREIGRALLDIRSDYATLLAVSVGIVGYFYVLFGGYLAVYRTDVLQFTLVAAMALAFTAYSVVVGFPVELGNNWWPRAGYWEIPFVGAEAGALKYAYQFVIGSVMGFGLLAAAPDAWKRVFVVTTLREKSLRRFVTFVAVGVAPFLVLVLVALTVPHVRDGPVNANLLFSGFPTQAFLFVAGSLGLVACFLSSYNSALLASVHVGLLFQRKQRRVESELPRFHVLMASSLLTAFFLFAASLSFANPYLLANLLLGPYALIAGIQAGTRAAPAHLPANSLLWIAVGGVIGWLVYLESGLGIPTAPTTYQVNTVPGGVMLFLIVTVVCKVLTIGSTQHV
ncbi:MAG: hypothetical protein EPO30_10930 [Lysobacteraceae bacterium]|nr:MAG: hypothetical protein EPO30_10930 [Xanthomonadaceae bacterium]